MKQLFIILQILEDKIDGHFQRADGWCESVMEIYCSTSVKGRLRAGRLVTFILPKEVFVMQRQSGWQRGIHFVPIVGRSEFFSLLEIFSVVPCVCYVWKLYKKNMSLQVRF